MSRAERSGWVRIRVPELIAIQEPATRGYQREVEDGHLSVFVGPQPNSGRWHLSISHRLSDGTRAPGRYPTWDEIRDAREQFVPSAATMAMLLPPKEEYVNIHATTFHLWQVDAASEIDPDRF